MPSFLLYPSILLYPSVVAEVSDRLPQSLGWVTPFFCILLAVVKGRGVSPASAPPDNGKA
jgi:hypothetical protein